MKKTCKKFIAVVMTLIMMVGITGGLGLGSLLALVDTYAAESFSPEQKIDENIMKDEDGNPVCGEGWALYIDGELVITDDFAVAEDGKMPWNEYLDEIKQVSVIDGVTAIPDGAFKGIGISKIYIPASVESISKNAFNLNENGIVIGVTAIYFGGTKDAWDGMNTGITIRVYSGHMHEDGSPKNAKKADCDGGYEGDCYCKNCGALSKQGKVLDAEHQWDDEKLVRFEGEGYENHPEQKRAFGWKCKNCDETKIIEWKDDPQIHEAYKVVDKKSDVECGNEGAKVTYKCSLCDKDLGEETVTEHKYGAKITEAPTCVKKGKEYEKCEYCGHENIISEPEALGHNYQEVITVVPTCDTPGEKANKCSVCDHEEWTEIIPVHTVGYYATVWETVKEPTCKEEGLKVLVCMGEDDKECGEPILDSAGNPITQTIPVDTENGHKEIPHPDAKEKTCTKDGLDKTYCEYCNKIMKNEVLKATGHDWIVKNPEDGADCTLGGGEATLTCSVCGETKQVPVKANQAHSLATETVDATCLERGYEYKYCTVLGCGYNTKDNPTYTSAALGHDWNHIVDKATCDKEGRDYYKCKNCEIIDDAEGRDKVLDKLNHKNGEWRETKAATCTDNGSEEFYCPDCEKVIGEPRIIPKLSHNWQEKDPVAPTCVTEGYTNIECTKCHETQRKETVAAKGHDWNYETAVVNGWEENYSKYTVTLTCKNDSSHKKTVPADISERVSVGDPTCTDKGKVKITATFDKADENLKSKNTYIIIESGDALGHDYDWEKTNYEWKDDLSACTATVPCKRCHEPQTFEATITNAVTTPATCEKDGIRTYTAAFDNEGLEAQTKTKEIKALGHDIVKHDAKPSTCKENGWDAYETCSRCDYNTKKLLDKAPHTPAAPIIELGEAATCTKAGFHYEVVRCSVCNYEMDKKTITESIIAHKDSNKDDVCDVCKRIVADVKINVPNNPEVDYGTVITVKATFENLPDGYKVKCLENGNTKGTSANNKDMTFNYGKIKTSTTLVYRVVDSDGADALNKDGNIIEQSVTINVKGGFFKILINFFRTLFGRVKEENLNP